MFKRDRVWTRALFPVGQNMQASLHRRFWTAVRDVARQRQSEKAPTGWDPFEVWQNRVKRDEARSETTKTTNEQTAREE